jgi:ABC-2 type transport system ATP-binding protein
MREMVLRLNRERGLTILLSSHLLAEVEQVCTHIAVMRQARLVWTGAINQLPLPERMVCLRVRDWTTAVARLQAAGLVESVLPPDRIQMTEGTTVDAVAAVVAGAGLGLEALHPVGASLEEFYLGLTDGAPAEVQP